MRHFNILFAFAAIFLSSCINDEVDYVGYQPSSKGGIHIIGAVEDYDVKSVGTRADGDDIADSYISEMTMFIFKSNGDLIQGYTDVNCTAGNECTSAINIQRGNPTFLIDTEEGILADLSGTSDTSVVYYNNNADDLGACDIYIVANAWHQLSTGAVGSRPVDAIKDLDDLEAFVYQVDDKLAMPMIDAEHHRGFPMIGKQQGGSFKLKKGDDNEGNAVATIPLKKLYSKVRFTMQINADQVVAGQTPSFKIDKVEVFNVPKKARLGRELDANGKPVYGTTSDDDYVTEMGVNGTYTPSDYYYFTESPFVISKFNKKTIYHSTSSTTDDIIEFGFYMPEHKVTPNTITYPGNITDEAKQYYKPAGVGQSRNGDGSMNAAKIATFVRIHGSYTDHNGQILGVTYDIYLGQNNYDDFTIKRNQLLNNKLIITGLTNHKDAYPDAEGNISIDHRVEVADRGFNLSMERTAILDAHFEVRPLDIELSPKSQMVITIPEEYRGWIAMENDAAARSGKNSGLYVNTATERKGVRKYFTTNLVSELNTANEGTITLSNNDANTNTTKTFRIWFYIDENPNVYDKTGATSPANGYTVSKEQYRVCPVQFKYMGTDKDDNTMTKDEKINFQQWNLWRVWSADGNRYYDIEHEEEYLNNYASDQQYGQTQNGMEWGLDGIQLSNRIRAIKITSSGGIVAALEKYLGWELKDMYTGVIDALPNDPKYDFYLSRDGWSVNSSLGETEADYKRDYNGITFNKAIADILKASTDSKCKINGIELNEDPKSAFAYCYNKNKRNAKGEVEEQRWFLPAIDEIEDIALGAYDEFDKVFQSQKYWSCQPAYDRNKLTMPVYSSDWKLITWGTIEADYFSDDLDRARATSIYTVDGVNFTNIDSGVPEGKYSGNQKGEMIWDDPTIDPKNYTPNTIDFTPTPGNLPRTTSCRIRAVYRSGTK
ncbi:MAG: DUF4906 domain-containing protein [Alistipes sp.]|nr:DUF4906 domain-containing protein [Alistipes sp.]MBR5771209.1 DUF4906 domain-containing protein [Alistipes sp.]